MDISLRPPLEIQAAHDRLTAIVLGEVPNPFKREAPMSQLVLALDVLCWVLQHEHNQTFAKNLAAIDVFFAKRGIVLRDSGELRT